MVPSVGVAGRKGILKSHPLRREWVSQRGSQRLSELPRLLLETGMVGRLVESLQTAAAEAGHQDLQSCQKGWGSFFELELIQITVSTVPVDLVFAIIVQKVTVRHLVAAQVAAKLQTCLVLVYLGQVRRQIINQVLADFELMCFLH
jgi:hypothetical protein